MSVLAAPPCTSYRLNLHCVLGDTELQKRKIVTVKTEYTFRIYTVLTRKNDAPNVLFQQSK